MEDVESSRAEILGGNIWVRPMAIGGGLWVQHRHFLPRRVPSAVLRAGEGLGAPEFSMADGGASRGEDAGSY